MEAPSFYVVSHERAGTHFAINTLLKNTVGVLQQANVGEWFGPYGDTARRFEHLDDAYRAVPDTGTLIKSHCDVDLFLARYPARPVLWVVRDPRDTLVSWFHYLNREEYYRNNPQVERFRSRSFGEFLRRPLTEFLRFSYSLRGDFDDVTERWAAHTQGWMQSGLPVCVVRYEELRHDFAPTLRRAADALGLKLCSDLSPVVLGEGLSHLPRKGIVGDWQNEATDEDLRRIDEVVRRHGLTEFYHAPEFPGPTAGLPPSVSSTAAAPRRLLLVRPDAYGDLVLFEPVLRALRQAWPQTEVAVLVRARMADIAPVLDPTGQVRWILTECDPYRQAPADCRPALDALTDAVRSFAPDCVVAACVTQTWLEPAVAAFLPGTRQVRLGPGLTDPLTRATLGAVLPVDWAALYPEAVPVEPEAREWENNLRLVHALTGEEAPPQEPVARVPAASLEPAARLLAEAGLAAGEYVACAAAGVANVLIKTWPAANYGEVLAWLETEHGVRALLIGHVSERDRLEAVRNVARAHGAEPALWLGQDGEMGLVAALLASARFYFGNDTGALHLAAALGRPVVAVFGGGTWPRFRPVTAHGVAVVQPLPCFGCGWECDYTDAPCVRTISTASVRRALEAFLASDTPAQTVFKADGLGPDARAVIDAATPRLRFLRDDGAARLQQTQELTALLAASEADRADRLRQVEELSALLTVSEADRTARQQQIGELAALLAASETDRTERQSQIEELTQLITVSEADRAARLDQGQELTALLAASEADRAARLVNMEKLTALVHEAHRANSVAANGGAEERGQR